MSADDINNPDYWRGKANDARLTAELISNPEAKAEMLIIGASFERMAVLLEQSPIIGKRPADG